MTFEEAIAQMRAGKRITRPEIRNIMHFSMAFDAYDHPFPVLLRHVNAAKPTEKERWRCFHLGSIPTYFVFAEDWEVFEDEEVKTNEVE